MQIKCQNCDKRRIPRFITTVNEKRMCCDCLGLCRECLKPIESDKQDENKCDCEKLSAVQKLRKKKRQEYETYNQQGELPPKL